MSDPAMNSPATERNRDPILAVLRTRLAPNARVLEIASGAGEHAVWFTRHMPGVTWRPSDPDKKAIASIRAWRDSAGGPNLLPPLRVDVENPATWPGEPVDAVVCINMIHIAPWSATEALVAGAARELQSGGLLYLYGPFRETGVLTTASNELFDADLKRRDPAWGLRELDEVKALADAHGFAFVERIEMPANNLSVWFEKG